MTKEMFWLTLTVVLTGVLWVPYIIDRVRVRGLMGSMGHPYRHEKPQSQWAQRMMHAHANAVENLAVFGLLVLITDSLNIRSELTAFACALYFWCRLAHAIVYALGTPVLRTLAFAGGFVAQALLALTILNVL
jgi:uncharacterized MAPEG superfamily protein